MAMAASDVARVDLVKTTLRAIGSATVLLLLYYLLPIEHRPHQSVALRLGVGPTFFVAGLAVEIRAIPKSGQPMLRAVPVMATVVPLFLVVFGVVIPDDVALGPGGLRRAADVDERSVPHGDGVLDRRVRGHHPQDRGRPGLSGVHPMRRSMPDGAGPVARGGSRRCCRLVVAVRSRSQPTSTTVRSSALATRAQQLVDRGRGHGAVPDKQAKP